jgi:hypothetical protein
MSFFVSFKVAAPRGPRQTPSLHLLGCTDGRVDWSALAPGYIIPDFAIMPRPFKEIFIQPVLVSDRCAHEESVREMRTAFGLIGQPEILRVPISFFPTTRPACRSIPADPLAAVVGVN